MASGVCRSEFECLDVVDLRGALSLSLLPSLPVHGVIEFQLCRSIEEVPYMAATPFRVIRAWPFLRPPCPPPPLTRYKREGYLCPEWYHRARFTLVPCTGIRSTGSSTLLDLAVSFTHHPPRMRRPHPEFLIIRQTFTKVPELPL